MKKILHITTHMGGGVGKALAGLCTYAEQKATEYKHKIILLEKPEKTNFINQCRQNNVDITVADDINSLKSAMSDADIVQLEWWHHPLMADFLSKFPAIPVRLVIWSHIAGTYYPWINAKFTEIPDRFIFTSPCSYDNKYWSESEMQKVKKNSTVVNSSGGFNLSKSVREKHKGFIIGYIGTQSFSKINRDFISYCQAVAAELPDVYFVMVGDTNNKQALLREAAKYDIVDKFRFVDYVDDVNAEFAKMDIFSYLLNPLHFGTTENVLLEAMACKLPVVCFNQAAEKYIVKNGKTGLLVNNKQEYVDAVCELYKNKNKRESLGTAASEYVFDKFSVVKTANKLHNIYIEILGCEKRNYKFNGVFGSKPHEYFQAGLPPDLQNLFKDTDAVINVEELPPILLEKNKSSLQHFARIFPSDNILSRWAGQ